MLHRVAAATVLGAIALVLVAPAVAQRKWVVSRTADGKPDLQGIWNNTTYVSLERPRDVNEALYTQEEALEIIKKAAYLDEAPPTVPGTVADLRVDFSQFALARTESSFALDLRTSLIVDPLDGRLPALTDEGLRRIAEREAMGTPVDAVQNQSLSVRCILAREGPPMLAAVYNNNYQFLQAPGTLMILVETHHASRVIPLDGRPRLPQNIRQLEGSSRGWWDGDTLVVETTNFAEIMRSESGRRPLPGASARTDESPGRMPFPSTYPGTSEHLRVTERFTRVSDDILMYRFTVDDPLTWTRPWTAEVPWRKAVGPLFEYACHEGNRSLYNTLAAARLADSPVAEAGPQTTKK